MATDLPDIFADAANSAKCAADLIKSLRSLFGGGANDSAPSAQSTEIGQRFNDAYLAILNAYDTALQAKTEAFEIQQRNAKLEQEFSKEEEWKREQERYTLKCPPGGTAPAMIPNAEPADGQPAIPLCPNCFDERRKSPLGRNIRRHNDYVCHRCNYIADPDKGVARPVQILR